VGHLLVVFAGRQIHPPPSRGKFGITFFRCPAEIKTTGEAFTFFRRAPYFGGSGSVPVPVRDLRLMSEPPPRKRHRSRSDLGRSSAHRRQIKDAQRKRNSRSPGPQSVRAPRRPSCRAQGCFTHPPLFFPAPPQPGPSAAAPASPPSSDDDGAAGASSSAVPRLGPRPPPATPVPAPLPPLQAGATAQAVAMTQTSPWIRRALAPRARALQGATPPRV
jgi:hypothetical protein